MPVTESVVRKSHRPVVRYTSGRKRQLPFSGKYIYENSQTSFLFCIAGISSPAHRS